MSYRWKPNASQRREFAERMKDPDEKHAYEERKYAKTHYNPDDVRSFTNKSFIPTKMQFDIAQSNMNHGNPLVADAARQIHSAYICQDKIHHDYIHIINHIEEYGNN